MATRKSGPVKPPTLDLTARKRPASKTSSRNPRAKAAAPKPAVEKPSATTPSKEQAASKAQAEKPVNADAPKAASSSTAASSTTSSGASEKNSGLWPPSLPSDITLTPLVAALIGIVGGAALGALLLIALLATGLLRPLLAEPENPAIGELATQVVINQEGISESLVGFRALNDQVSTLNQIVDQQTELLQGGLETQRQEVQGVNATLDQMATQQAALEGELQTLLNAPQPEPAAPFDPSALEQSIAELGARLEAIAAGASTDDAQIFADEMAQIRNALAQLETLNQRLDGFSADLQDNQQTVSAAVEAAAQTRTLAEGNAEELTRLATLVQSEAASPAPVAIAPSSVQIPLALMGLDAALDSGRPFEGELEALGTILPELEVPPRLNEIATEGLLRPDELVSRFNASLTDLLAAKPIDPDAGWRDNLWERIKSLLALRPTGETGGDSTEALVANAEAAVNRRDFAAASAAVKQLPEPMRLVIADLALQFEARAGMETLLAAARNAALAGPVSGEATQ